MIATNEFKSETFFKEVFYSDICIIIHGNISFNHIFKKFYVLPDEHRNYLMKIKLVELILYKETFGMLPTKYRKETGMSE